MNYNSFVFSLAYVKFDHDLAFHIKRFYFLTLFSGDWLKAQWSLPSTLRFSLHCHYDRGGFYVMLTWATLSRAWGLKLSQDALLDHVSLKVQCSVLVMWPWPSGAQGPAGPHPAVLRQPGWLGISPTWALRVASSSCLHMIAAHLI